MNENFWPEDNDDALDEVLEEEIAAYFNEQEEENNDIPFGNYRKNVISIIAYLIALPDEKFDHENLFVKEEYEKLQKNDAAKTIRYLSKLRMQFMRRYKLINDARKYNMRPLETMSEYLDIEAIKFLRAKGMEVNVPNAKTPSVNIAYINQYILDCIDKIKPLIPDWIQFKYIKDLFLMPGAYAGHNGANLKSNSNKIFTAIYEAGKSYATQRNSYPFRLYLNWPCRFKATDGNILYHDYKFLKLLYAANADRFQASQYVVDAQAEKKEAVYDFLAEAVNVAIFVDCENVDPYAFGATILNLDKEALSKIKKIILYDDVNTSTAWDYIADIMDIPVEKKNIVRLLENKSLVDITMATGVCQEHYQFNMESIILSSSDSDFWGLIQQLPQARFLVLNEYEKTSSAVIAQLDKNNIQHCYMSDFAQDIVQTFKSDVLYLGLMERIKHFNETGDFGSLDVNELLQQLFFDANIKGAGGQIEKEREAFFNKYLKNGLTLKPVMENGKHRLKIELYKK